MSKINEIPDFYDWDAWLALAPDYDWSKLVPAPPIEVTATAPTFDDTANTYTIPTITGVEYLVDGVVVPAGTVSVGDVATTVTVTAQPDEGYVLLGDTNWTGTFTVAA